MSEPQYKGREATWPDDLEMDDRLEIDGHTYVVIGTGPGEASIQRVGNQDVVGKVLAVFVKYGSENWDRWVAAARDRIAEWFYEDRIPARFTTRSRSADEETMADICEGPEDDGGALYYGDLRASMMQISFAVIGDAEGDDDPVQVVALTSDGERDYADPKQTLIEESEQ